MPTQSRAYERMHPPRVSGVSESTPRVADGHRIAAFCHVMHTHGPRSMFDAQGADGGGRIVFAIHVWLVNTGIGKRRTDESFARGSDQHRIPGGVEPLNATISGKLCSTLGLENPSPGSMMICDGETPA